MNVWQVPVPRRPWLNVAIWREADIASWGASGGIVSRAMAKHLYITASCGRVVDASRSAHRSDNSSRSSGEKNDLNRSDLPFPVIAG